MEICIDHLCKLLRHIYKFTYVFENKCLVKHDKKRTVIRERVDRVDESERKLEQNSLRKR